MDMKIMNEETPWGYNKLQLLCLSLDVTQKEIYETLNKYTSTCEMMFVSTGAAANNPYGRRLVWVNPDEMRRLWMRSTEMDLRDYFITEVCHERHNPRLPDTQKPRYFHFFNEGVIAYNTLRNMERNKELVEQLKEVGGKMRLGHELSQILHLINKGVSEEEFYHQCEAVALAID